MCHECRGFGFRHSFENYRKFPAGMQTKEGVNMKRLIVLTVLVLTCANFAHGDNSWGAHASYWDTKDAEDSYGMGLKFSIEALPNFNVDLRLSWFDDIGKSAPELGITHYSLEIVPLEIGGSVIAEPSERLLVYGGGGLGYYFMNGDMRTENRPNRITADPDDEIGFYLNAGFEFIISEHMQDMLATRATIFAEVMYRFVEVKDLAVGNSRDYPVEKGKLDGFGVNLGFMLHW